MVYYGIPCTLIIYLLLRQFAKAMRFFNNNKYGLET